MNAKRVAKIMIDVVLTAMIVIEMFIQFTGVFLHEVIGFAFFISLATHLILSAKWIKNTASNASKGKMTARRTALAVMAILLAIAMIVLGVSSVAISTILASAGFTWTLGEYALWATIHSVSSYSLCALVTIHLCMHWAFLASAFRVPYNPSRRRAIATSVNAVAAVGAVALGVMAVRQAMPRMANASTTTESTSSNARDTLPASDIAEAESGSKGSSSSSSEQGSRRGKKPSGASGSSASSSANTSGNSSGESGSQNSSGSSSSSSTASGICTLCRKQCPLSAPQCNKPYAAGLI